MPVSGLVRWLGLSSDENWELGIEVVRSNLILLDVPIPNSHPTGTETYRPGGFSRVNPAGDFKRRGRYRFVTDFFNFRNRFGFPFTNVVRRTGIPEKP